MEKTEKMSEQEKIFANNYTLLYIRTLTALHNTYLTQVVEISFALTHVFSP